MAKRFTDSEKFRNSWYRGLPPRLKCAWEYLLSECSLAGILELDLAYMSFHIGEEITQEDINSFGDRIIDIGGGRVFMPSFIRFQQGTLNINNKAHKNAIKELEKYNIPLSLDTSSFQSPLKGASKGLQSPPSKGKGNSNDISVLKKKRAREKVEFRDLSVSHIEDWLCEKRASGRYLLIDEFALLEVFKDYCMANGRVEGKKAYKDFVAAFRASFDWEKAPRKGNSHETHKRNESSNDVLARKLAEQDVIAAREGGQKQADIANGQSMLCHTEHLREKP